MPVFIRILSCAATFALLTLSATAAQPADKERAITLGEGKLTLEAPEKWVRKEPRTRIVEHEFAVEGKKGQDAGRVTVMAAGGSIEDNINRWIGQFKKPDAKTKSRQHVEKRKVAGLEVEIVDLAGTYRDMPGGPRAGGKAIDRENYRMLGAIIPGGPSIGNYFIKFYGPAELVKENEKAFHTMIESLSKK
ncbi:MAG: hypothetical protein WD894_05635 [Pirellulales bacterium]